MRRERGWSRTRWMDRAPLLQRHNSGAVSQVSSYVVARHALDVEEIAAEYRDRVASPPTRRRPSIVDHNILGRAEVSGHREELLARRMYEIGTTLRLPGWEPIRIVDFSIGGPLTGGIDRALKTMRSRGCWSTATIRCCVSTICPRTTRTGDARLG
jgi:hypothetical protein